MPGHSGRGYWSASVPWSAPWACSCCTISSTRGTIPEYWDIDFCTGLPLLPPDGGRGAVKLAPLRRRSRGELSGWEGKAWPAVGPRPRFTPTLALPHQGGG